MTLSVGDKYLNCLFDSKPVILFSQRIRSFSMLDSQTKLILLTLAILLLGFVSTMEVMELVSRKNHGPHRRSSSFKHAIMIITCAALIWMIIIH